MTEQVPTIAAIIPAYNEADRIPFVLKILAQTDFLDEILVVDDGSSDETAERVRQAAKSDPRIRLIQHQQNLGKGQAILTGRAATQAAYLILLDADLIGLKPEHLRELIQPVLTQRAEMTVGLFRGGRLHTDFSHWLTPWLSGQRGLRAEVLDVISPQAAAGYGFETALTLTAARYGFHTQRVILRGVWHIPSEFHRRHGFCWRLGMYFQILRAWQQSGGWQALLPLLRKKILPLILVLLALLFIMTTYGRQAAPLRVSSLRKLNEFPLLTLTGTRNLMLLAPHPDDETLAAGGVIQAALSQGAQVHVIVVTHGDGQKFAPAVLEKRLRISSIDYLRLGERREAESRAALHELGLSAENILFLGYPDRGLSPMWLADWNTQCPYTAPYTRATMPPYQNIFDPRAEYCGNALLGDLVFLLENYRPDLILLPHPADQHPDHRALSAFVRMAVAIAQQKHPEYTPRLWGYLVHYGSFPQPRGNQPQQVLLPPKRLWNENWGHFDLSPHQVKLKARAIRRYTSQRLLLGDFLPSFARRTELFVTLSLPTLSSIDYHTLSLPATTIAEVDDPDLAALTRIEDLPVRGNAISDWQIGRLGDSVLIKVQTHHELLPAHQLRLWLKLPDGHTQSLVLTPAGPLFGTAQYLAQLDLDQLGQPALLGIAAELHEGRLIVSESGWHILSLNPPP